MAMRVDYDALAGDYSSRYRRNDYSGVTAALAEFCATDLVGHRMLIVEVGCGTGHWLDAIGTNVVGIDPSPAMLQAARAAAPAARLVRAQAEAIPFHSNTFDRMFCINALHHFTDPAAFFVEARRVLRPGGAVLTVGLDPHTGHDRWWIYDYFPDALVADRMRYLPASAIRAMMASAGFERCETREVQHLPRTLQLAEAESGGFLARTSASQLLVIGDEAYERGIARIRAAGDRSPDVVLRSDLRLYGTTAWRAA
jgi:SAM-dependent methyltransferase